MNRRILGRREPGIRAPGRHVQAATVRGRKLDRYPLKERGRPGPQIDDDIEVDIDEKDLRIDTYRSSGAGGQHVNVTDSAVRITHLPSGVVVQCQAERSQHRNRAMAMKVLQSRLYELERQKQAERIVERQGEKKEIGWGSQIRSYVLQPYQMAKDHRTGLEVGNVTGVLDGQLDPFAKAYLKWAAGETSATTEIE